LEGGGGLQLFQAEVGHPKQLISRVVVIVKDLKLQPQFLFMRAHLSVIEKEVSPVRIEAIFLGF
jgi:hypothetical protein